jgi:ribosomal protein S18 acetylase RimI-like enzyme
MKRRSQDSSPPAGPAPAWREAVRADDPAAVAALCAATGFFSPAEVEIAAELAEERLAEGEKSGYAFLFAEDGAGLAGYTCYGPIPGTAHSYDLYWIVVDPRRQGAGLGRALLAETEARIVRLGGRRLYAETSSRAQYAATRAFYLARGFHQAALLEDFYAPGDGKVIFVKVLD